MMKDLEKGMQKCLEQGKEKGEHEKAMFCYSSKKLRNLLPKGLDIDHVSQ